MRGTQIIQLGVFVSACLHCGPRVDAPLEALRAEALPGFQRFQQELQSRLGEAVAKGGPVGAISVCRVASPRLEQQLSTGGIAVRRVSDRPRNPEHKPDEFEARTIAAWAADVAAGKSPSVVAARDGDRLRVMKPILIGSAMCLSCHGSPDTFSGELRAALLQEYPLDRAVGYRLGDLRGAFSASKNAPQP